MSSYHQRKKYTMDQKVENHKHNMTNMLGLGHSGTARNRKRSNLEGLKQRPVTSKPGIMRSKAKKSPKKLFEDQDKLTVVSSVCGNNKERDKDKGFLVN